MSDCAIVKVERTIAASPERVFDAWLEPAKSKHFLFATEGGEIVRCEIDARVGGRFLIVDRRADGDAEHHGQFVDIDRPRRLASSVSRPAYGRRRMVEGDRRFRRERRRLPPHARASGLCPSRSQMIGAAVCATRMRAGFAPRAPHWAAQRAPKPPAIEACRVIKPSTHADGMPKLEYIQYQPNIVHPLVRQAFSICMIRDLWGPRPRGVQWARSPGQGKCTLH